MGLNTFAANLRYLLKRNDVPIEDLAYKAVVPLKYLIRYPTAQAEPNIRALLNLSEFFQVPIDTMLKSDLEKNEEEASTIRVDFLALDVDGVLTDSKLGIDENGNETRQFNILDMRAIKAARKKGVHIGFVSGSEKSGGIEAFAKKLGVEYVYCGKDHKIEVIRNWCEKLKIELDNVAYIGDDVNDVATLRRVGLAAVPGNAHDEAKFSAKVLLVKNGGEGAVREFVDRFITKIAN